MRNTKGKSPSIQMQWSPTITDHDEYLLALPLENTTLFTQNHTDDVAKGMVAKTAAGLDGVLVT